MYQLPTELWGEVSRSLGSPDRRSLALSCQRGALAVRLTGNPINRPLLTAQLQRAPWSLTAAMADQFCERAQSNAAQGGRELSYGQMMGRARRAERRMDFRVEQTRGALRRRSQPPAESIHRQSVRRLAQVLQGFASGSLAGLHWLAARALVRPLFASLSAFASLMASAYGRLPWREPRPAPGPLFVREVPRGRHPSLRDATLSGPLQAFDCLPAPLFWHRAGPCNWWQIRGCGPRAAQQAERAAQGDPLELEIERLLHCPRVDPYLAIALDPANLFASLRYWTRFRQPADPGQPERAAAQARWNATRWQVARSVSLCLLAESGLVKEAASDEWEPLVPPELATRTGREAAHSSDTLSW